MSRSLNLVFLMGYTGSDPGALRYTRQGNAMLNMRLATNKSWKDKQTGEQKQSTKWHDLVFYGATAEYAQKRLRKGSHIWIMGSVEPRVWEQDGQTRSSADVVVSQLEILDSKNSTSDNTWEPPVASSYKPMSTEHKSADDEIFDDDIPF